MRRLSVLTLLLLSAALRAEQFDYYTFPVLNKAVTETRARLEKK